MSNSQDPSNTTTDQPCEFCEAGGGVPARVLIAAGCRSITYRCAQCGRRWTLSSAFPDPATSPRSREGG